MLDHIKEPNMYDGRYNGMDLGTRAREYERDLYLYNIAKNAQENNTKDLYKHITMVDVDEIIDDDEYDSEDFEDEYTEIDNLKDRYMRLREQREDYKHKSVFTPIQDVDYCIIVLAYIIAIFTIPFESVSTPLAFIIATIISFAIIFGQKFYRATMKNRVEHLDKEMKQLRKEIKLKEGR